MLDLQPRVHFQKVVASRVARPVDEELDRARVLVAGGLRGPDGGGAETLPERWRHRGGRRLLDDLLMAPLNRTFALEEMDDRAVAIGHHLHFDVARAAHETLDVERPVAERRERFAPRRADRLVELVRARHGPHALAAPPADALTSTGSPSSTAAARTPASD